MDSEIVGKSGKDLLSWRVNNVGVWSPKALEIEWGWQRIFGIS